MITASVRRCDLWNFLGERRHCTKISKYLSVQYFIGNSYKKICIMHYYTSFSCWDFWTLKNNRLLNTCARTLAQRRRRRWSILTLIHKDPLSPELCNFSFSVPNSDFYSARVKKMLYISLQNIFLFLFYSGPKKIGNCAGGHSAVWSLIICSPTFRFCILSSDR